MANFRAGRIKQEIQREVNDILAKRVKDPRVANVNITDVESPETCSKQPSITALCRNLPAIAKKRNKVWIRRLASSARNLERV